MAEQEDFAEDLRRVVERFPQDDAVVRRLVATDPAFRSLCEDYSTALAALLRFSRDTDDVVRSEVLDYRRLIAELEVELAGTLKAARARDGL